jgi:hypothetical protein
MKRVSFLSVVVGMVMLLTLSVTATGWATESHDLDNQSYGESERQGGNHSTLLPVFERSNDHDTHDEGGEERQGDSA